MRIAMLLLACSVLAGCADRKGTTSASASFLELTNAGEVNFRGPHGNGTLAAPGRELRSKTVQQGSDAVSRWTIDGHELEFLGEELLIGGKSFGSLAGESKIVIGKDGVFVNGERRGAFPP